MEIGILGTGAFGLALSSLLVENNNITMWTKFTEEKEMLEKKRKNKDLLPDYELSDSIIITTDLEECLKNKDLIIVAIPTSFITDVFKQMKKYIKDQAVLIASKGMTEEKLLICDSLQKNALVKKYGVLGGPNFAKDVIKKEPLAFTVASKSKSFKKIVSKCFTNSYVKIQYSSDVLGVELSGLLKNIYAIISGMLDGMKVSESTKAFFLNNCIYESAEIIKSFGGNKSSILCYSGMGDMILTCTSIKSRNYKYGLLLGNKSDKKTLDDYLDKNTVEGYIGLNNLSSIIKKNSIDCPMIKCLFYIIKNKKDVEEMLKILINY